MSFKVTFPTDMKTGGDYGPIPLGEYPCQIKLRIWQTDANGTMMTTDGKPVREDSSNAVPYKTSAGDMLWYVDSTVLAGDHLNKIIQDNWSFGKAIGRVWTVVTRLGLVPEGYKLGQPFDLNPEEIDETYWWVTVDSHELSERNGVPTEAKYPYKSACPCNICKAAVGKNVFVNAKVGFAGYRLMSKDDVKKYRGVQQEHAKAVEADPDKPPF